VEVLREIDTMTEDGEQGDAFAKAGLCEALDTLLKNPGQDGATIIHNACSSTCLCIFFELDILCGVII
jgi:hypothetical protein